MNMLNVSTKRINLFKSHHSVVILTNEHIKCVKKTPVSHGGQSFFGIFGFFLTHLTRSFLKSRES